MMAEKMLWLDLYLSLSWVDIFLFYLVHFSIEYLSNLITLLRSDPYKMETGPIHYLTAKEYPLFIYNRHVSSIVQFRVYTCDPQWRHFPTEFYSHLYKKIRSGIYRHSLALFTDLFRFKGVEFSHHWLPVASRSPRAICQYIRMMKWINLILSANSFLFYWIWFLYDVPANEKFPHSRLLIRSAIFRDVFAFSRKFKLFYVTVYNNFSPIKW